MTVFRRRGRYAFDFWHQAVRYTRSGFPYRAVAKQAQEIQRARLVDQRLAKEYGIGLPRARVPLVRHFFEKEYLPEMRATRAHSTVIAVRSALKPFILALGANRLTDVTTRHLEAYRDLRQQPPPGTGLGGAPFHNGDHAGLSHGQPTEGAPTAA